MWVRGEPNGSDQLSYGSGGVAEAFHVILSGWKSIKVFFMEILLVFVQNVEWPEGVSSLFVQ